MSLSLPSSLEINIVVSSKIIDHHNRCWNVVWKVQNRKFTNTQIQETASEKSSLSTCEQRLLLDCCQESRFTSWSPRWGRRPFRFFFLKLHIFLKYFLLVFTTDTIKVDKYYRFHKNQSSYIQHLKLCCQKVDFSWQENRTSRLSQSLYFFLAALAFLISNSFSFWQMW